MSRFLVSLFIGLALGVLVGLYLGWVQFPVQYIDSPAGALARSYKDQYTVMIAAGFAQDGDVAGAVERLRVLGVENIPAYVLEVTERYITNSQNVADIRLLVQLYEGLAGRVTPLMEPYRQVRLP
ncbi:MAG: hypothetical protein HXY40_09775 [Chloroflexi bacterium]|nr:hypothetical protein [Chloroflexota bacterium]